MTINDLCRDFNQGVRNIHDWIPENLGKNTLTSFGIAFIGGICFTISPIASLKIGILAASITLINSIANNFLRSKGYDSLNIAQASLKNTVILLSSFALCSLSIPSSYTIISTFVLNLLVNSFIYGLGKNQLSTHTDKAIIFLGYTFLPVNI